MAMNKSKKRKLLSNFDMETKGENAMTPMREWDSSRFKYLHCYCREEIFKYLNMLDRLNFSKAYKDFIDLDKCLWKVSECDAFLDYNPVEPYPLFNPVNLQEVFENCGSSLIKFTISIQDTDLSSTSYIQFNDTIHYLEPEVDSVAILDLISKFCENLEIFNVMTYSSQDITKKIYRIIEGNKNLKSLNITCHSRGSINRIINLNHIPERMQMQNLKTNLEFLYYDLRDNTICAVLQSQLFNLTKMSLDCRNDEHIFIPHASLSLDLLASYGKNLNFLDFDLYSEHPDSISAEDFKKLGALENLTELKITLPISCEADKYITHDVISEIYRGCIKLQNIRLNGTPDQENRITNQCMDTIMSASSSLQRIDMYDFSMQSILSHSEQSLLKEVHITRCAIECFRGFAGFKHLTSLTLLVLHLSDDFILVMNQNCRLLEKLVLGICVTGEPDYEIHVPLSLPNLLSYEVSNLMMQAIIDVEVTKNLKSIQVINCIKTQETELNKLSRLENLEILFLEDCDALTDGVAYNICSASKKLKGVALIGDIQVSRGIEGFKNLTSLVLEVIDISDDLFLAINQSCVLLENFELTSADKGESDLEIHVPIRLPMLLTYKVEYLTMETIIDMEVTKYLTRISISDCKKIPQTEFEKLSLLKNLVELSVWNCETFTNAALHKICCACKKLKVIEIEECSNITIKDDVMHIIRENSILKNCWRS